MLPKQTIVLTEITIEDDIKNCLLKIKDIFNCLETVKYTEKNWDALSTSKKYLREIENDLKIVKRKLQNEKKDLCSSEVRKKR